MQYGIWGGEKEVLRKIYRELVKIRKELQAIRSSLEPKTHLYTITKSDTDDLIEKDVQVIKTESGVT